MDEANASGNELPTSRKSVDPEFLARIGEVIDAIKPPETALSATKMSPVTIARWRNGQNMPPFDKVTALCRAAEYRVEWVATGEGPRRLQPEVALPVSRTEQEHGGRMQVDGMELRALDAEMVSLPRLNISASAGVGLVPLEEEVDGFIAIKREYLRYIDVSPAHAHIAMLSGDSMKPTLLDRDLIIVDTSKTEVLNERIYAVVYGDAVLAKRIQLLWDGSLRIMSDNKADGYTDEVVPASERDKLRIVGRIKGYLRHF